MGKKASGVVEKGDVSTGKEGFKLLGDPTFKKLENGRFKCVQTGHELPEHAKDSLTFPIAPEAVEKPGDNSLSKLKMLYTQAKELSESEMSISNQLLGQLDAFSPAGGAGQQRRRIGNEQKKKRMKGDSDIPRLSPSMRNQQEFFASLKGEQVAARVAQEDGEKDEWVIVKVTHYDKESKEFEVLDEEPGDDEEGGGQRKYNLPWSHIIPFPKISDLATAPEFPPGKQVLAVYPATTALYKATVVQARKRKTDDYTLEFDDDEEDGSLAQRLVPFNQVVALPYGHRQ